MRYQDFKIKLFLLMIIAQGAFIILSLLAAILIYTRGVQEDSVVTYILIVVALFAYMNYRVKTYDSLSSADKFRDVVSGDENGWDIRAFGLFRETLAFRSSSSLHVHLSDKKIIIVIDKNKFSFPRSSLDLVINEVTLPWSGDNDLTQNNIYFYFDDKGSQAKNPHETIGLPKNDSLRSTE